MGILSRQSLANDLAASLHDASAAFATTGDIDRLLDLAAEDFYRSRPRTMLGEITLADGVADYALPADCLYLKTSLWGLRHGRQPWDKDWPGMLPRPSLAETAAGRRLVLTPAPTGRQIGILGATYRYYYGAAHAIGDTDAETTIAAGDRGLLILRAQAEAMRELALRNVVLPVQMRDGFSGQPRNGTPSALHAVLMDEFERRAL